jgi:hypothetical protein
MFEVEWPGGIKIRVQTLEDLKKVLSLIPGQVMVPKEETTTKPSGSHVAKLTQFYARLDDVKQKQFLGLLCQSPGGVSDEDLRTSLKVPENKQLGGMMSGLSKNAKRAGLKIEDIIFKEMRMQDGKKRSYNYKITPFLQSVIKKAEETHHEIISPLLASGLEG